MKIALFTDTYTPQINGVVTSTLTFVQELRQAGHDVVVMGPKLEGAEESTETVWRFRSMPFPFQPEYRMIAPLSRKLSQFKEMKFDVIHVQTPFFMGHLGQYLSWKYHIPLVHTYHTHWEEYLHYFPLFPQKMRKMLSISLLSKQFCNRCDHVVVPSAQMKEKLVEYGVSVPLTVIPTGVDFSHQVSEEAAVQFRYRWGISLHNKVIIFVGRLGLEKNVYFLLEALVRVVKHVPQAVLVIAGDGPERHGMAAKARSLQIEDHCLFTGYVTHDDVFTAYAASDVLAFPSKTETQGLSLLEGLSMAKPAVCLNAMGVKDVLNLERGGYLTSEDPDEFAQALITLLTNEQVYAEKSQEAYAQALQFSSAEMAKKLIQVYHQAMVSHRLES